MYLHRSEVSNVQLGITMNIHDLSLPINSFSYAFTESVLQNIKTGAGGTNGGIQTQSSRATIIESISKAFVFRLPEANVRCSAPSQSNSLASPSTIDSTEKEVSPTN